MVAPTKIGERLRRPEPHAHPSSERAARTKPTAFSELRVAVRGARQMAAGVERLFLIRKERLHVRLGRFVGHALVWATAAIVGIALLGGASIMVLVGIADAVAAGTGMPGWGGSLLVGGVLLLGVAGALLVLLRKRAREAVEQVADALDESDPTVAETAEHVDEPGELLDRVEARTHAQMATGRRDVMRGVASFPGLLLVLLASFGGGLVLRRYPGAPRRAGRSALKAAQAIAMRWLKRAPRHER